MPETVADLIERKRRVSWECDVGLALGHVGAHVGEVNLERVLAAKGPDFTFANRRPRCKVKGCPGRVQFKDSTSMWWRKLDTITDHDQAWWKYHEDRNKEMFALGWDIVGGYWKRVKTQKRPASG